MHPKSPDERETLYGLFCLFSLIGDELGQRLAAEHSRARKSCQAKISIMSKQNRNVPFLTKIEMSPF